MNILKVISSSRMSGAERHMLVLAERLRQRGYEVTAVCPPGGWLPDQLRGAGVPTIEMAMHGGNVGRAVIALTRIVRDRHIELIHSHLTAATYQVSLVSRLARVPVVCSVHVPTRDLVYRRLFPRRKSRIVTVSDFIKDGLMKQGVPAQRLRTVYNGTDFCASDRAQTDPLPVHAELSLPADAELIGCFARVGEFKGHYILANALPEIVRRRPNAYVVCVGPVDSEVQKELWRIGVDQDVAERMRFTGPREDVPRLMSAMDVVTLPSRFESCSMAIIEAMAMGKAVVASRAGGNPELVCHGETGLLVERNVEALSEGLVSLLDDAGTRERMGAAARIRAQLMFSAEVMADNMSALYTDLIGTGA